jgi:molybdopterin molybdotransferase
MIELKEALQTVLDSARPLGAERVVLSNALGRILAEDVASDTDVPPFDKATVDGYACRRADLGHELTVVETIPAGRVPTRTVGPNQCAKIMTGAAVPLGADCVIMIEQTEIVGPNTIRFAGVQTPENIFRRGMDVQAGQVVLQKGSRVGPQHVAVLASLGHKQPLVARRPRVGIIATGDELVAPEGEPGPSQIRDSNRPQLAARLAAMGLIAHDYGIARDVAAEIEAVLKTALDENDVVLVSGGVSVGDFDLAPAALQRNHVRLLFEKVAVKPGKPTVFGIAERASPPRSEGGTPSTPAYCFGLPGNPVSTFVIFELLVKPFLYRLMGYDFAPAEVRMRLDEAVTRKDTDRQSWIPVRITSAETAQPIEYRGSPHLSALCSADGLVSMDIGVARLEPEAHVRVRLLGHGP